MSISTHALAGAIGFSLAMGIETVPETGMEEATYALYRCQERHYGYQQCVESSVREKTSRACVIAERKTFPLGGC